MTELESKRTGRLWAGQLWTGWMFSGVLALGTLCGSVAYAQAAADGAKDDLFAGTEKFAQGASGVSEINMDPESLGLVSGDRARRAHGMVLNVVRSYTYDKPGMYRAEDVDVFRHKLDSGDWRCSVHTRDLKHGDSTDVCNRHRTDGLVESAIITVAPKSLTFIHTIRKGGDPQSQQATPALTGEARPGELPQMARIEPLSPFGRSLLEADRSRLEASARIADATMAARMAALGPEMEARMGAQAARLQGLQTELQLHLQKIPAAPLAQPE